MSKPNDLELKTALNACAKMKEHNDDPLYIAKSLLNLNYRIRYYEELLIIADRYMNHGQAEHEHEHAKLLRCIEEIKEVENKTSNEDINDFGLE